MHRLLLCRLLIAASIAALFIPAVGQAADRAPGPVKVSSNGRLLVEADGKPFFWLGDTAWELFRALTLEEARVYLDDRAKRGFNVIQVPAVFGGYGTPDALQGQNRYGNQPFIGGRIEEPNPKYFAHVDQVIDEALARGLRVAMHPIWGALNVSRPDFLTAERARSYGKWLGERYRGKSLIWVLGGDVSPIAPRDLMRLFDVQEFIDYRPIWDAMAQGIAAGEGGDPFFTYHPPPNVIVGAPEPRTSLFFSNRAWLDMNAIQSGHEREPEAYLDNRRAGTFISARNYEMITDEYWSSPVRPVIDFEVRYEHSASCIPKLPDPPCWKDHDVRGVAYQAVFAGAAGHSYGNYSLWDFFDPSRPGKALFEETKESRRPVHWRDALAAAGGDDMRHLKALMLSRPYLDRIPDQSVIVTPTGVGDQHIAATRSRGGSYLMVYLPQSQRVVVDLTKLSGEQATGWWFNPRTGEASRIKGNWPTNDRHAFIPPTRDANEDWVLVLDDKSRDFDVPGRVK